MYKSIDTIICFVFNAFVFVSFEKIHMHRYKGITKTKNVLAKSRICSFVEQILLPLEIKLTKLTRI